TDFFSGWDLNFTGENVEKTKDNSGFFRYTKLTIFFDTSYKKDEIEKSDTRDFISKEIREKVSNIINRLIDVYRYVSKEEYVERLGDFNILNIYFFDHNAGFYPL